MNADGLPPFRSFAVICVNLRHLRITVAVAAGIARIGVHPF